jgi:type II secretory pathway pseudopilin PulG
MEFGAFGIFVLVISCACSFLLARWLGKRRRDARRERERRATEAAQSRQVRRARERRQQR